VKVQGLIGFFNRAWSWTFLPVAFFARVAAWLFSSVAGATTVSVIVGVTVPPRRGVSGGVIQIAVTRTRSGAGYCTPNVNIISDRANKK
jgi:hypothetical protein